MTDDQLESMFISITKSIGQLGEKIEVLSDRITTVELGQEDTRRHAIRGIADGVSRLLGRR